MRTVGSYEAKTHLARLLDDVEAGERITITRHGVPVAVLAPTGSSSQRPVDDVIADLRAMRADRDVSSAEIREWIAEGRP